MAYIRASGMKKAGHCESGSIYSPDKFIGINGNAYVSVPSPQ